ncbi:MAG: cation-transporting P-type ATPase [Candidatus Absconditabacteria bacterium]|nr:cation-transporting P-type ATPase [Candidatus Absconditabacteria bacterium]
MEKNQNYYQYSIEETLEYLGSNKNGISKKEVHKRLFKIGKNKLESLQKSKNRLKFLGQFKDVLIILLTGAMLISLYLKDYRGSIILGAIIIINAIIGYLQEAKAEKIIESLKKMVHSHAKVKRNGKLIEIAVEKVVPGDIIYIEEGDSIPADLRIIENNNLQTNDFALTGESNPVSKFTHAIKGDVELAERNNCVFMGTTVATGFAWGVVIATGMETQLGKIANLSQEQKQKISPLELEMKNIAQRLTIGTLILSVILVIIALFANFSLQEAFIFAVGIAAAMVPQGLPAQVNIALSLAAGRLAKNKALVKQLASVETLGSVNIICTDKTGTLTKNEMTVKKIFINNQWFEVTGTGYEPLGEVITGTKNSILEGIPKDKATIKTNNKPKQTDTIKHLTLLLHAGIFASNAKINPPDDDHPDWYCLGDPTEGAILTLAKKYNIETESLLEKNKQYHQFGFDSIRKMMSSIRDIDGKTIVFVKGAPRTILENCTTYYNGKEQKNLTNKYKESVYNSINETSSQAMRNIAFAYKEIDKYEELIEMTLAESDLCFLGFVAIIDPARSEVPAAIRAARDAKIKIIMITGDYGPTAKAIAENIGLDGDGKMKLISNNELKKLSDYNLYEIIKNNRSIIFSRVAPEDKLRIVKLLQKKHNIIAVTGDGINDAPALKRADIGVAMGKIGTDVAKEASKIILLDDSFNTLVYAIQEGRIIYQNLKKTILSSITSNGGELFAILISLVIKAFTNIPIAISAVQILAIDLIGEMGPLTALTRDPAQKKLMKSPPRKKENHILNKKNIIDLIRSGALMGLLAYGAYYLYLIIFHGSPTTITTTDSIYMTATSITYTTIVFCQYANIISRRASEKQHIFTKYFRSNKKLLRSFVLGIVAIIILIYSPINNYLGFGPMSLNARLFPIGGGLIFLTIRELYKYYKSM